MEHLSPCCPFRTLGVPGRFYVEQPLLFPDFLICISRSSPALALDPTLPPSFLIQLSHYHLLASGFSTPGVGFPGSSAGKESTCNAGDLGLIPGLGRSPGGGHGSPLQYSCLKNLHGQRRLAGYSPWGHKGSDMTERLSPAPHPHPVLTAFLPSGYQFLT